VAVFLVEKSGRLLNLEEGKNTIAGTINTIMSENLALPPVASQVFCVWLISPLLREYMYKPKFSTEFIRMQKTMSDHISKHREGSLKYDV